MPRPRPPPPSIEALAFDASAATTAPAETASAESGTTADLCGALTVGGVDELLAVPALGDVRNRISASLSVGNVVTVARSLFGCGPAPSDADPAQVKARVCAVVNVPDLTALRTSLSAELALLPINLPTPTEANVATARTALGCSTAGATTTSAAPTTSAVAPATTTEVTTSTLPTGVRAGGSGSQVTQVPVGAADTGAGPGLPAPFWIAGALMWLVATATVLAYARPRPA